MAGGRTDLCLGGKRGAEEEDGGDDDRDPLDHVAHAVRDGADPREGVESKLQAAGL